LSGDRLRGAEADELVEGVGDRAGRVGEHLADLVRGEGGAEELAQVLLDQVAQRPGPGGGARRSLAATLITQRAWAARSRAVSRAARAMSRFPAAGALPASAVTAGSRPRLGAGFRLLVPGGAVSGSRGGLARVGRAADRLAGGLPGVGGAVGAGGLGGLVGRGFLDGGRRGVGDAGPAALDPGGGGVLLVGDQGLPGGGGADPGAGGDLRDGRPGGFGRQRGQDGRCRAFDRRGGTGAGAGVVAVSAALRAACGAGAEVLVRPMMVTPFLFSGAIPVFVLTAPMFSGRQLLWLWREVKRLRNNSRRRFRPARRARKYVTSLP
jgi:hypothetical protein